VLLRAEGRKEQTVARRMADGRGQGIVQARFHQHAGGQLGEGRPPAPSLRFASGGAVGRGGGQAELGAVQRHQPPSTAKGLGLACPRGQGPQGPRHQLGDHLPGSAGPPVGARALTQAVLEEEREVLGQRARGVHEVRDQGRQQRGQRDARLASAARRLVGQLVRGDEGSKGRLEAVGRLRTSPRRACRLGAVWAADSSRSGTRLAPPQLVPEVCHNVSR